MQDYIERFNNLNQLIETIQSRPTNKTFEGADCLIANRCHKGFYGVDTPEDAFKLCLDGWNERLEEFKEPSKAAPTKQVKRPALGPVGFAPHVPNAIQGRPDSMIYTRSHREKTRSISITVDISVGVSTDLEDMFTAGREIFRTIQNLEDNGIHVNLDVCFMATQDIQQTQQKTIGIVNIKKSQERLNPKRVYFPLVHPAMFRILGFKFQETAPVRLAKRFARTRGTPMEAQAIKSTIKTEHIISLKEIIWNHMKAADIKRDLLK